MSATPHNARDRSEQSDPGLPLAIVIHEGGDQDTFLASPTVQGEILILELSDGRTIEIDRQELLDRAA